MSQLFQRLEVERAAVVANLEQMVDEADAKQEDLTDEQLAQRADAMARIDTIDKQLASLAERTEMNIGLAEKIRSIGRVSPDTDFAYRSVGSALWDMLHQGDRDANQRYKLAIRAAEHMGTEATNTTPQAGDLGGLAISPVVGPIANPLPAGMPFLSAIGLSTVPSATFARPYISDPDFATGVGEQALEKGELASQKFDVLSTVLSPTTYGGYLNVSAQLIALQAGALDIIVGQLRRRLALKLEGAAITELALTTGTETIASGGSAASVFTAIYNAAAEVMTATQQPAEWIAMGPLGFAKLGAVVDAAGRPLFPTLGPANAPGTSNATGFTSSVAGLRAIVTPAITGTELYVGNSAGFEGWWYPLPLMEAVEPSVLGRQVAVAAMFAPFRPTPFANSVVKITWAA